MRDEMKKRWIYGKRGRNFQPSPIPDPAHHLGDY
jgi:hypothetical protein